MWRGSVHSVNTSARDAAKIRVATISRSPARVAASALVVFAAMSTLLLFDLASLHLSQVRIQSIKTLLPEAPVVLDPVVDFFERARLQPAGAPLGPPGTRDQMGPLPHLQVLGDRRQAHPERLHHSSHKSHPHPQPP